MTQPTVQEWHDSMVKEFHVYHKLYTLREQQDETGIYGEEYDDTSHALDRAEADLADSAYQYVYALLLEKGELPDED